MERVEEVGKGDGEMENGGQGCLKNEAISFNFVTLRKEGSLAVLTVGDPPANTLTYDMIRQLDTVYQELLCDPRILGVMLTGAGERFFSGGVNIGMLCSASHHYNMNFVLYASEVFERIANGPLMVFAAVNGNITGGGLELALIAEHRFAVEGDYNIGFPEVKLGVIPGLGGTQRLKRIIGAQAALELITQGEFIDARRACDLGIFEAVFTRSTFSHGVLQRAHEILDNVNQLRSVGRDANRWVSLAAETDRLVGMTCVTDGIAIITIHESFCQAPIMDALYALDQAILAARMEEDVAVLLIAADNPATTINRLSSTDPLVWDYANYIATRLENFPRICACVWEGHMESLGAEIALACDYRLIGSATVGGSMEVSVGNAQQRLKRYGLEGLLGKEEAVVINNESLGNGLAVQLMEADIVQSARCWLSRFSPPKAASLSIGYAKIAIVQGQAMTVHAGMQFEQRLQEQLFRSNDGKEGMKAYLEKRSANFTGEL